MFLTTSVVTPFIGIQSCSSITPDRISTRDSRTSHLRFTRYQILHFATMSSLSYVVSKHVFISGIHELGRNRALEPKRHVIFTWYVCVVASGVGLQSARMFVERVNLHFAVEFFEELQWPRIVHSGRYHKNSENLLQWGHTRRDFLEQPDTIIHGTIDDNVVVNRDKSYVFRLILSGKKGRANATIRSLQSRVLQLGNLQCTTYRDWNWRATIVSVCHMVNFRHWSADSQ